MASRGGADLTYTEMVSAAGLAHGSSPTRHLLEVLPGEGPVACQLFGAKPDELAFAAREVAATGRFVELNLNAGCPVPRIVREGAGSALVKDPVRVHDLLVAMVGATNLPVTLKTRPGPRPDKVLMFELLDAAETAGAKGITLHARFTSQNHGGEVHLDLLSELVERAKIRVGGNGGVKDAATARAMAETGVGEIMVGRAALANPQIFEVVKGGSPECDRIETFKDHLASVIELHEALVRDFPEDHITSIDGMCSIQMHTHLFRYFSGRPGAAELRRRLNSIRTLSEILSLVASG
jgi:tRNA-dihydrouridine synthase